MPVYKNKYKQLAAMYDDSATADKIEAMEKLINEKYEQKFIELYNAVWAAGKAYSVKPAMQVRDIDTAPTIITNAK